MSSNTTIAFSWQQVLNRRMARQYLVARARPSDLLGVVRDVCGVQAQVMSWAELALWARIEGLVPDDVRRALWEERTLFKTWAMRGTLHLFPADDMALRHVGAVGADRDYKKPAWLRYHGVTVEEAEAIISAVPAALDGGSLTREELGREVAALSGIPALAEKLSSGWGALLKPSASRGHLCFGPSVGRNVTFARPDRWLGRSPKPDPNEAEEEVLRRYLRAYGPATHHEFARWWGVQPGRANKVFARLSGELAEVSMEGWKAWALAEDLEDFEDGGEGRSVSLLPGFDQYVLALGPVRFLLPEHLRGRVYRPKGAWYSPVLLVGSRIRGVWRHERRGRRLTLRIEPFERLPAWARDAAESEARRLARFLGREEDLALDWSNP